MTETAGAHWYVMRVYKKENQAEALLREHNMEYFIPRHYIMRMCHGKKQRLLVPLIPSLVFVRGVKEAIHRFKYRYNTLFQYVVQKRNDGLNSNMIVPDNDMNSFMTVAGHYDEELTYLRPEEVELNKGTRVRIHGGIFDGAEGVLMRIKNKRSKRLVVTIPGIISVAATEIEPEYIEVID